MSDAARAKSIFLSAIEEHQPHQWPAFLDSACADDLPLREEVEELLNAFSQLGEFEERSSSDIAATIDSSPITEQPGNLIGRYKLVHEIGQGGMGVVYMAVQKKPVKRKVALKVIKPGMDTREVVTRFEGERQALALMDHQSIARVLDGGSTESGRPYFVMELVDGTPITEYCDAAKYNTRQRLELFVQVCQAVQHAHQKGVIHRDIKPSNILVTNYDDIAVPKVIDFGIAKALHQQLADQSVYTHVSQMIGTPLYMSPEQAQRAGMDVDTRTDVYSLGVLLYELLTGTTPFDKERLKNSSIDEVKRIIQEEEPPRPSTRLSTLDAALETVAENHSTNPRRLCQELSGELDWIVMKALEKDRQRRYESAADLVKDIKRYLDDEPVEACPPSKVYRFRKFARRNKGVLATLTVVAVAIIAGTSIATWQAVLARRAAARAELGEQRAAEEAERARTEAEISSAVINFLTEDLLEQASPSENADRDITLRAVLDRASDKIGGMFPDEPLVAAMINSTLGRTYRSLGEGKMAVFHQKTALDLYTSAYSSEHPLALSAANGLTATYLDAAQFEPALKLAEETHALCMQGIGPGDILTMVSMNNLGMALHKVGRLAEAIPIYEEALELHERHLEPDSPNTLTLMNNLAMVYFDTGRAAEAVPIFERNLEIRKGALGPKHPDTLLAMNNLAYVYQQMDRLDEALPLFQNALNQSKETLGPDHPDTLMAMNNLAAAYRKVDRLDEALPIFEQALKLTKDKLGPDHIDTLRSMYNLTIGYIDAGHLDEARPIQDQTLKLMKEKLGTSHPRTLSSTTALARAYQKANHLEQALPLLDEALEIRRTDSGPSHIDTLALMGDLTQAYLQVERSEKALALVDELLKATMPGDVPPVPLAGILAKVALTLLEHQQFSAAETCLRECLSIRDTEMPDHWLRFNTQSMLGGALAGQGESLIANDGQSAQQKFAEAEPLLVSGYQGMKANEANIPPQGRVRLTEALQRLVALYTAWGKADEAVKWQEVARENEIAQPQDKATGHTKDE